MAATQENEDQKHPQEKSDRETVQMLLRGEANERNLAELARLRIRYYNFPGAREIQQNLDLVLQKWQLTEAELFRRTREIHRVQKVYFKGNKNQTENDWS